MGEASKQLRRLAVVVLEQSAEPLLAADFAENYGRAVGRLGFGFCLPGGLGGARDSSPRRDWL